MKTGTDFLVLNDTGAIPVQLAYVKSSEAESTRLLSLLVHQTDAVIGRDWAHVHKDHLVGAFPVEIYVY